MLKIKTKENSKTIKVVNSGHAGTNNIDYLGNQQTQPTIDLPAGKDQRFSRAYTKM